jgi:hypothetical protein
MKAKFLLIPALVGVIALTSCKHGPSEETTKAVNDFETSWTALGQTATTWGEDLKATAAKCAAHCAMHDTMKMDGMPADAMTKCTEMTASCKSDKGSMDAMVTAFDAFATTWGDDTKAFGEWKAKIATMKDEEVKTGLAGFQTKMDEAKAKIDEWNTAYAAAKETCMKNMTACADMGKMMMDQKANAKDTKGKKK